MPTHLQYAQVILQALSAFSIAAGLIFAAYQFWHLRRAQLVANFSKLVELQMHLRELRVHDPELASTFSHDVEELHSPMEIMHDDFQSYVVRMMQEGAADPR